jgi:hypothetical protein
MTARRVRFVLLSPLDRAFDEAAPVLEHLTRSYGTHMLGVVYAVARSDDGPVRFGHTGQLVERTADFLAHSPDPVSFVAVLPGRAPLESYLQRRYASQHLFSGWHSPDVVDEVIELQALAERHYKGDLTKGVIDALREFDPELAQWERLYLNGVTFQQMADLAGIELQQARQQIDHMKKLGFNLPNRNQYASRTR